MTPIPPPLVDGVLYIDNSSMELFTTCPRQALYYIIRRRELNRSSIALDFGGAFHGVLEYRYKKYGVDYLGASQAADCIDWINRIQTKPPTADERRAHEEAQKRSWLPLPPYLVTPEDDYRTRGYLIDGMNQYVQQYPAETFSIARLPSGDPAVEIPFAFPLGVVDSPLFGRISIVWTGKIDLVYESGGSLSVLDHKTTSMMGPQFFSEFEIAHQMYGYVAATEYVMGRLVERITINGLGCRKPTKTGQRYEFNRHHIPVSRPILAEWHDDCLAIVSDFIGHCERGYFPKHTKWCIGKYGACQFRPVCGMAPEHREFTLTSAEYRNVTWSPLRDTPPAPPASSIHATTN